MAKQRSLKAKIIVVTALVIILFVLFIYQRNGSNSTHNIGYNVNAASTESMFECPSKYKGKIHYKDNYQDKLSLIVGDESFRNSFGEYCDKILNMEIIKKSLKDTSSFWIIDHEEIEKHPNYKVNEIKAPFFTNKELDYKFNVHTYDYVYLFVNRYNINLKDTFKLIDYSNKINVTCFVIITNILPNYQQNEAIQQIEAYLKYLPLNYITFHLKNVYLANDTKISHNHDISLLFHHIIKHKGKKMETIMNIFDNDYLDILYFQDVIKYIAISPLYQHLFNQKLYIKSSINNVSIIELTKKMFDLYQLNTNINTNQLSTLNIVDIIPWNKFNCYFLSEKERFIETSIDNILNIIKYDLMIDQDIVSRKTNYQRFDKSAVFCDNRFDDQFVQIVLNFMINLDQTWQFELYVGKDTMELWTTNKYLKPYIKTEKIVLKDLGIYYKESPIEYYSNIEFWQSVNHEKILTFHADSVLCSGSYFKIEDFLEYDYIGAPWRKNGGPEQYDGRVGNGGLSLRSKSFMIKLLTQYPQNEVKHKKTRNLPEDYYLNRRIALLSGVHLPRYSIARFFSIENDYVLMDGHNIAAGIHRHYIKKPKEFERLVKLCPEFNMTAPRIKYWDYEKDFWEE